MKTNDYTEEELELLEAMENKPLVSVPNLAQEMEQLKASVKTKLSKRKSINLRLLENDYSASKPRQSKRAFPIKP